MGRGQEEVLGWLTAGPRFSSLSRREGLCVGISPIFYSRPRPPVPGGQRQWKLASRSRQVLPGRQGWDRHSLWSASQREPV